ncbi:MAG: ASKHA domain-containing protein [Halanaerobiales bacterium]|nr:ASKHA domain-containing protein [Halanaerobiales bacterium]
MSHTVKVRTKDKVENIKCKDNENLLKVLLKNGYDINAYCGGEGICGKCKVKLKGELNPPRQADQNFLEPKELKKGYRLSCMYKIKNDIEVIYDQKQDITVMTDGTLTELDKDMDLLKHDIKFKDVNINNQKDYLKRIFEKTDTDKIEYDEIKKLADINKRKEFSVFTHQSKIVDITKDTKKDYYGLSVDIGTTTIVIYLINLSTGEEVGVNSFYNPQKKFGADVISRINYTNNNENGIKEMQDVVIDALNQGINQLVKQTKISNDDIYKMAIVGNTIMLHLLAGIDALSIAKSPYIPTFTDEIKLKAKDLNLNINKKGLIFLLPSISGYVGADITGDMLTINIDKLKGNNLMIDIGTNGEIVLNKKDKIVSCSAAAGPAFEGANITFGSAGVSGAISKFEIKNEKFNFKTINDQPPIGICGSGLLDMIAEFFKHGFIESSGKITNKEKLADWKKKYVGKYKDQNAIKITKNKSTDQTIYLTQKDIREVQLAKGAIAAGIEILLQETDLKAENLDRVFIAGGFGNYINPDNACFIKMIPECLKDKIIQIGNGAGTGAKIYLLNQKAKKRALAIKEKVKYIELSVNKEFQTEYINSMNF